VSEPAAAISHSRCSNLYEESLQTRPVLPEDRVKESSKGETTEASERNQNNGEATKNSESNQKNKKPQVRTQSPISSRRSSEDSTGTSKKTESKESSRREQPSSLKTIRTRKSHEWGHNVPLCWLVEFINISHSLSSRVGG
jgi:hypothetical protein